MARTATLCPGGMRPLTVTPSPGSTVPETSCRRAMTTSSAGWMRMTGASSFWSIVLLVDERGVPRMHALPLLAQALDAEPHLVAGLQVQRRLLPEAHTPRRA